MIKFFHSRSMKFDLIFHVGILFICAFIFIRAFSFFSVQELLLNNNKLTITQQNNLFLEYITNYMERSKECHNYVAEDLKKELTKEANVNKENIQSIINSTFNNFGFFSKFTFYVNGQQFFLDHKIIGKTEKFIRYKTIKIDEYTKKIFISSDWNSNALVALTNDKGVETSKNIENLDFNQFLEEYYNYTKTNKSSFYEFGINSNLDSYELRYISKLGNKGKEDDAIFISCIKVSDFSTYLNQFRTHENARIFVIGSEGQIIADSKMDKELIGLKLTQIADTKIQEINKKIKLSEIPKFSPIQEISIKGKVYYIAATHFPKSAGLEWQVVSVFEQSDFLEGFLEQQKFYVLVNFSAMLLMFIFLYFQAAKFSEPIENTAIEATKIKHLELDDHFIQHSKVREINEMSQAMHSMKITLKNLVKYVPKSLVRKLNKSKKESKIGGFSENICIMFTDIVSFSTIAESTEPAFLANHLSEYFEELTNIISSYDGIIDKFIGDAVMCFWGAPEKDLEQEKKACMTALECQRRLKILNDYWASLGRPQFLTRIGLNSGKCIVGNIGSEERMNYTALGDMVNLASRLEGSNKFYGTKIIISDAVRDKLPLDFVTRRLDIVKVKGKKKETVIYELIGTNSGLFAVDYEKQIYLNKFEKMLHIYANGDFEQAKVLLEILKNSPYAEEDCVMLSLYENRIEKCLADPIDINWTPVLSLTEK